MKNTTTTKKTVTTKNTTKKTVMFITVDDKKKYVKFVLDDNRVLAIAFKNSKSLNTYFHKDFSDVFKTIANAHIKKDIEKHPDAFEYQCNISSVDSLKDILTDKFTTDTVKVQFKSIEEKA